MKITWSFFALLLANTLAAQTAVPPISKGITPLATQNATPETQHSTRAVVVGISDYQSPAIPDLKYANTDAEAFAGWLQSTGGGSLPADNVQVLLNSAATLARLTGALTWLMEESKAGDQAVIYFSGHGDVEVKTDFQLGFLLPWDSPAQNYMAGGYPLFYLQAVISTLSNKNVRVLVITDACHAGKLAGSDIGGASVTGTNLARQFAKEIKILSCAPNEFSVEGKQWGGGRGAFSFYLVNGLSGFADLNSDAAVNLLEIGRYLQDHVSPEVAPLSQTPMIIGLPTEKIAFVDASAFEKLKAETSGQPPAMKATESRGLEDDVLARAEPAARATYQAFKKALAERQFFGSPDSCADALYRRLVLEKSLEPLHNTARRNFAVALLDEPQQALNALLESDPYETNNWQYNPDKYAEYPHYLQRSMELLGAEHFAYQGLLVKKLYFEGYQIAQLVSKENATAAFRDSVRLLAKDKILAAIALDPQAAYLYHAIGHLYWYNSPPRTDSLVAWCERASEWAPQWLLPYLDVGYEYNVTLNEPGKAEPWLLKAAAINPNSYYVQERLSWLYQWLNRTDESLALSEKMISEKPELFNAYATAGVTCLMRKEFDRAERYFDKAIALEPGPSNWAKQFSIFLLAKTRRQRAAYALSDSIFDSPAFVSERENSLDYLRVSLLVNGQYEAAGQMAEKELKMNLIDMYRSDAEATLGIAQIKKGNYSEGRSWLEKARKTAPTLEASLLRMRQYTAVIAEKEGHIARADSLYRAAFGYRPSGLSSDNRLADQTATLREDYARFLLRQNREAEATEQINKLLEEEPNSWRGYYCMAVFHADGGHEKLALDWLEKALDRWLPTAELMTEEVAFKKIWKTKRFAALLAKHFPEGKK